MFISSLKLRYLIINWYLCFLYNINCIKVTFNWYWNHCFYLNNGSKRNISYLFRYSTWNNVKIIKISYEEWFSSWCILIFHYFINISCNTQERTKVVRIGLSFQVLWNITSLLRWWNLKPLVVCQISQTKDIWDYKLQQCYVGIPGQKMTNLLYTARYIEITLVLQISIISINH